MAKEHQKEPETVLEQSAPRGLRLSPDRKDAATSNGQTGPLPPNWRSIGQVAKDVVRKVKGS